MNDSTDDPIQKAMAEGAFDNLPGMGKPLNLEHDRLVPEEYRMAYRIMRDNDMQPEWVMIQKEIIQATEDARRALFQTAHYYAGLMTRLAGKTDYQSVSQRLAAMDRRDEAKEKFRQKSQEVNEKIRLFNLKVPFSHLTRDLINADHEISQAFPA